MTRYGYNVYNRLQARGYADGKNDTFAYDRASRLTRAATARYGNEVQRAYDAAGRLVNEHLLFTSGIESGADLVVGYAYDAANRPISLTYPDGSQVTRDFTARNELFHIWDGAQLQSARTYDQGGRLVQSQLGNGLSETRTYVANDNLVATIRVPGVTDFAYQYDADKRKTVEQDRLTADQSQRFAYDDQSRLTTWKRSTGVAPADPATVSNTWALSPVGDWKSVTTTTSAATTVENRTHSAVHELLSINGTALAYDAKGNLTRDDQGQQFAWDVENRLQAATNLQQGQGNRATYAYDALGRRVKKAVTVDAVGSTPATTTPSYFVHAGAQEVTEITGDLSAFMDPTADSEGAGAAPFNPATGTGARGSLLADAAATRVNFQPASTGTPDGWRADVGTARPSGTSQGWTTAVSGTDRDHLGRPLYDSFIPVQNLWQIPVANGTHAVVIMCGDADSRAQTNSLLVNGVSIVDPTPYDGRVTNGYETGAFDGYALTVNVSNGLLTIAGGAGALNPKINFIEIGAAGSIVDAGTSTRVAAAAAQATKDTAKPKAKMPPVVKRNVWGVYVDELVSYTLQKPRHNPVRYYTHSNHLYSVAATTNTSGQVVERYSYNAYGVRTVKNSAGVTLAKSAVGQDRGFTGYKLDSETGLYFARARMYSARLGRFISRDSTNIKIAKLISRSAWFYLYADYPASFNGYGDGLSLYSGYFVPNKTDSSGRWIIPALLFVLAATGIATAIYQAEGGAHDLVSGAGPNQALDGIGTAFGETNPGSGPSGGPPTAPEIGHITDIIDTVGEYLEELVQVLIRPTPPTPPTEPTPDSCPRTPTFRAPDIIVTAPLQ